MQSKFEEALAEMQKEPEPVWRGYGLALAYHASGNKKEADAALAEIIEKYQNEYGLPDCPDLRLPWRDGQSLRVARARLQTARRRPVAK